MVGRSYRIKEDAVRKVLFLALTLNLIAGCSQATPAAPNAAPNTRESVRSVRMDSASPSTAVGLATATCGESTLRLMCPAAAGAVVDCTHPSMQLEQSSTIKQLRNPVEMSAYAPVGVACTHSRSNKPFFVVQFGELPEGCESCEWFYVYSPDGNVLTISQPAMLGSGPDQVPNNREYDQLTLRMGLSRPTFDYAHCDRTADRGGAAICLKEVKDDRTGDP
jgi:hypothetical protein